MLARIEQKVAATLGDKLATRTHVDVLAAPGSSADLEAGNGRIVVALQEVLPANGFHEDEFALASAAPPVSRRILNVQFVVLVSARMRPQDDTPQAIGAARTLLLEDLSHAAHVLAEESFRNGKALRAADPDPGYEVISFALENGTVGRELVSGTLGGELRYRGSAQIWPPGQTSDEGIIDSIETRTGFQPLSFEVKPARVVAGTSAQIVVRGLDTPVRLAVRVTSDLDPAKRGAITSGEDGAETGVRIIDVPPGTREVVIDYSAPEPPLGGTQFEFVAVHFATPDDKRSALLGSTAVRVVEPAP